MAAWAALWLVIGSAASARAQSTDPRLRAHISFLAAQALAGRGNGSDGARKARDYIVSQMRAIGLKPAGAKGYLTGLPAVVHSQLSRSVSLQIGKHVLAEGVEFAPTCFSDSGAFDADAVFVGYGLSAPSQGYDDYAGTNVRGKVVVALTGAPSAHVQSLEAGTRAYLMSARSKAAVALAHGARALLLVNDPRSHGARPDQRPDTLPRLRPDFALKGLSVARLTERAGARVLADASVDLAEVQRQIDRSDKPLSRALELRVQGDLSLERRRATIDNVVGMIPGTDHAPSQPIIVTAHYDGLGFGEAGSLSKHLPALHPGADDNASGVAVLLELARALAHRPPAHHPPLIFATPAGEELGLRGSRRMATRMADAYGGGTVINFDMLGRLRDQRLHVALASPSLRGVLDATAPRGLHIVLEGRQARHTDYLSFYDLGFRALNITTGHHVDYHMPGDTIDKINWKGLDAVRAYIEALLRRLATHTG